MKLSKLIDELKNQLKTHGDCNVYYAVECDGYLEESIDEVVFEEHPMVDAQYWTSPNSYKIILRRN